MTCFEVSPLAAVGRADCGVGKVGARRPSRWLSQGPGRSRGGLDQGEEGSDPASGLQFELAAFAEELRVRTERTESRMTPRLLA